MTVGSPGAEVLVVSVLVELLVVVLVLLVDFVVLVELAVVVAVEVEVEVEVEVCVDVDELVVVVVVGGGQKKKKKHPDGAADAVELIMSSNTRRAPSVVPTIAANLRLPRVISPPRASQPTDGRNARPATLSPALPCRRRCSVNL